MRGNPDPKPGRWALPLVILGMVGATYLVVSAIEPAPVEEAGPTTTSGPRATQPLEEDTTTTTLEEVLASYLQALGDSRQEAQTMLEDANGINQRWDDDEANFNETLQALEQLADRAQAFADSVETNAPPAGSEDLAEAHAQLVGVADRVAGAAADMVTGLRAPDTGQQRRAALEAFSEAVGDFGRAVGEIEQVATGTTSA